MTDIHLDVTGEARLHQALRRCWHPVARVEDLQERPLPVSLLDEQLVRRRSPTAAASRSSPRRAK